MREINLAVIHCSATRQGTDYSVSQIRDWHVNYRKFRDIGYHFLIHLDGRIERGRPWDQPGAHAKGYNNNSIGVCYVGGTDGKGRPMDTRSIPQIHSLRAIVSVLKAIYPLIDVRPSCC